MKNLKIVWSSTSVNHFKKLIFLSYLLLLGVFVVSCEEDTLETNEDSTTQIQTVSDPDAVSTITTEQIKALGQQSKSNKKNRSTKQSSPSIIVLDFEGLANSDYINDFYNGGTSSSGYSGTDYGVEFGVAMGIIDSDDGGSGNFANEPSPSTIMFFLDANQAYMNVEAGFSTGFSFYYSASLSGTVSVYDGINGTGNLLGTVDLPANHDINCTGDPNGTFCNWEAISVAVEGIAKSVVFGGSANYIGFDDVTFGSLNPGSSDSDSDGILDENDNCSNTANPGQEDNDGDGFGDACDDDDDNDSVLDVNDNCPFTDNPGQEDYDGDGLGDACDDDDDNDGVLDINDSTPFSNMEETVTIGDCDSNVNNIGTGGGDMISDQLDAFENTEFKNKGQFRKAAAQLMESLLESGLITEEEKDALMTCAGQGI